MHTIIAIALVSATQALLQCTDYCKLISYNQPVEWRPDCNCSIMKKGNLQINPFLSDTPDLLYDTDTSNIYYEPAKTQRSSYIDQPFYLINPTVPIISKRMLLKNHQEEGEIDENATKNYKHPHIHKINIETEDLPLYLDIDIHKPTGQGRSTMQTEVDYIKKTEDDLIKCIDLNVLIVSRQDDLFVDNKEIFKSNDMEQYSGMSDSELMAELKDKCDLPASLIERSLQEIKDNLPKKDSSTVRLRNDVSKEINIYPTQLSKDNTTNDRAAIQTIPDESNVDNLMDYINNTTIFQENAENTLVTATTIPSAPFESEVMHPYARKIFPHKNNVENVNNHEVMTTESYEFGHMTNNTDNDSLAKNNSDFQERTAFQVETIDSSTFQSSDQEFTTSNVPITGKDLLNLPQFRSEQNEEDDNELNVDIKSTNTMETFTSDNNEVINPYYVTVRNDVDQVNHELIQENLTSSVTEYDKTSRVNRTQYLEGEYQIPKIISKELPNDTIISVIDGSEKLPNLDFVVDNNVLDIGIDKTAKTEDVTSELINSSEFTTASNVVNTRTNDENIAVIQSDKFEINGELFFQYGDRNIPAHFVQNSDGKINVAIDGASICDELFKRAEVKSLLVTSLCNCVQSRNCTQS